MSSVNRVVPHDSTRPSHGKHTHTYLRDGMVPRTRGWFHSIVSMLSKYKWGCLSPSAAGAGLPAAAIACSSNKEQQPQHHHDEKRHFVGIQQDNCEQASLTLPGGQSGWWSMSPLALAPCGCSHTWQRLTPAQPPNMTITLLMLQVAAPPRSVGWSPNTVCDRVSE